MDVMAKQESVFTKEHMDRLLAEDRRVDATGKLGSARLPCCSRKAARWMTRAAIMGRWHRLPRAIT